MKKKSEFLTIFLTMKKKRFFNHIFNYEKKNWFFNYIFSYEKKIWFFNYIFNYEKNSFQIEWNMIVVRVFLSIKNQTEFYLAHNPKENCHYNYFIFNLKGIFNLFLWE